MGTTVVVTRTEIPASTTTATTPSNIRRWSRSSRKAVDRLELARGLDAVADPLARGVSAVFRGRVSDFLHGVWLGHPLHPAMVQIPVGAWVSAALLDAVPEAAPGATALVGI